MDQFRRLTPFFDCGTKSRIASSRRKSRNFLPPSHVGAAPESLPLVFDAFRHYLDSLIAMALLVRMLQLYPAG